MARRTMAPRTIARATVRGTARGGRNSSERLVALYLDMLAAERGAGKNTLAAYGRDLADFTEHLAGNRPFHRHRLDRGFARLSR